jgi:GMP synthase-like glutamine amidotransferase
MKLHYFQHVPFEGLAHIQTWADSRAHAVSATPFFRSERLPPLENVDLLVVLGGPMGATDDGRFSWMRQEKIFIEEAISRQKKVLGICLGAQLIADVLGARVYPNREKEIGWFPIELNPPNARHNALGVLPQRTDVFHWHGDTFDLPAHALHLARSRACENQAFSVGPQVLGLQFHLEMGPSQIDALLAGGAGELVRAPFIQTPREILELTRRYAAPLESVLYRFLDAFAAQPAGLPR